MSGGSFDESAKATVRFIIANSKIRGNRSAGLGLSSEKNISEKLRDEWLGALARADEEAIQQEGFVDWNDYWLVALSQEMTVPDFVRLLETHLSDPARLAAEIKQTAVPIRMLVMSSLREAFANDESWLFQARNGGRTLQDYRLRPREAAEWFLRRPLDKDKLPGTLRAFLESSGRQLGASAQSGQPVFGARPAPKISPATKGKPQLAETAKALREIYGERSPANVNRSAMQEAVKQKLGRTVSLSTLDRGRRQAWP
jgi:hypothetical protein